MIFLESTELLSCPTHTMAAEENLNGFNNCVGNSDRSDCNCWILCGMTAEYPNTDRYLFLLEWYLRIAGKIGLLCGRKL
jgi:hypothetical protein